MDDQLELALQKILKKNRVIWGVVLAGMLSIILLSFVLYYFNIIDHLPIVHPKKADNISLVIILFFVLIIFYIKQTILSPAKLIEKSKRKDSITLKSVDSLLENGDEKRALFLKCVQQFNRNILIVWFLANLVVLTSFVNFIVAPIVSKLITYSLVGLFSLVINFPKFYFYKRIYRYIYE